MIAIGRITHAPSADDPLVRDLVGVFCDARKDRLQFLMDLHDADEDRHFLAGTVLPANEVWVARVDGAAAGFIAFADGWVNHLYVAPRFQGRGVGTRLLDLAKRAYPSLQLWVFEVNLPAVRFYESRGFRVVERTDGAANEARRPDARMRWDGDGPVGHEGVRPDRG